jgi:hypothetical protein
MGAIPGSGVPRHSACTFYGQSGFSLSLSEALMSPRKPAPSKSEIKTLRAKVVKPKEAKAVKGGTSGNATGRRAYKPVE